MRSGVERQLRLHLDLEEFPIRKRVSSPSMVPLEQPAKRVSEICVAFEMERLEAVDPETLAARTTMACLIPIRHPDCHTLDSIVLKGWISRDQTTSAFTSDGSDCREQQVVVTV